MDLPIHNDELDKEYEARVVVRRLSRRRLREIAGRRDFIKCLFKESIISVEGAPSWADADPKTFSATITEGKGDLLRAMGVYDGPLRETPPPYEEYRGGQRIPVCQMPCWAGWDRKFVLASLPAPARPIRPPSRSRNSSRRPRSRASTTTTKTADPPGPDSPEADPAPVDAPRWGGPPPWPIRPILDAVMADVRRAQARRGSR